VAISETVVAQRARGAAAPVRSEADDAAIDAAVLRRDFPIRGTEVNGHPLVYLDNAASSQKPRQVIDALLHYYAHDNANVHRGAHTLAARATDAYERTRALVAGFVGAADAHEIVFTRNATESINLVARSWSGTRVGPGDEIVVSQMEHHSNLVPWQMLSDATGARLVVVPLTPDYLFDLDAFRRRLTPRVRLVAVTHMSNVLGTIAPVAEIARLAHAAGAMVLVDGAQSVPHLPVDVRALDCDFLAFSAHKMLGPTGVGVLWARRALLDVMPPFLFGGSMIGEVTWSRATWAPVPQKFEAGTPNIAGVAAFGAAIEYLNAAGMERVRRHEQALTRYALQRLCAAFPEFELYGPTDLDWRGGVIAFNVRGEAPHAQDIGRALDARGIAIRAGRHCAAPLHAHLGVSGSARASFSLYNTEEDVDALIDGLDLALHYTSAAASSRAASLAAARCDEWS
jgi:cysteine desulfurase/selenocysteine lyase